MLPISTKHKLSLGAVIELNLFSYKSIVILTIKFSNDSNADELERTREGH